MRKIIVLMLGVISGGIALLLLGNGQNGSSGPDTQKPAPVSAVLVATRDLQPGDRVQSEDFRMAEWPEAAINPDFVDETESEQFLQSVAGNVVRRAASKDLPVKAPDFSADSAGFLSSVLSPGMRAVAISTSADQTAGGLILPDNRVDVMLTVKCTTEADCENGARTEIILQNVRVLAIDQAGTSKGQAEAMVGKTATLEVSPEDAARLISAKQAGTLTLLLRASGDLGLVSEDEATPPAQEAAAAGAATPAPAAPESPARTKTYDVRVVRQGVPQTYELAR